MFADSVLLQGATVFMGFFAIMNPLANVPIFLSLTADDDPRTMRLVAIRSLLLAFGIVLAFVLAGKVIFDLFGITLAAFRLVGGVLVGLIGFDMLHGKQSSVHQLNDEDNQKCIDARLSVAVFPLAMPILAGPGTIVTAMSYSSQGGLGPALLTVAAFALLCVITFVVFVFGRRLLVLCGEGALGVITRLMGLILAVIGAQMLIDGIRGAFLQG